MAGMSRVGFLHTAEVHVATFDALVGRAAETTHVVAPSLLDLARASGPSADVEAGVRSALTELVDDGAAVIVCTGSTLGPIAEDVGGLDVPVLRVDRPMIRAAVGHGSRIGVVAAVESTLDPTRALIADEAGHAGVVVAIVESFVPEAWASFEAGATAAYLGQVADAARSIAPYVDSLVLAQASMAGARVLLDDLPLPVLTSPEPAVDAALDLLAR
jgi:hypothetical protein